MSKTQKYLLTGTVLGLLAAAGAYFLGREQDRIRSLYGDAPQKISLAQLAEKGYGDNIWVDLTDVELGQKYVTETRKGSISAVWVPAFPKGLGGKTNEIKVVLRTTRSKTDQEIAEKFKPRPAYRGAVINPILLQPHDPYRAMMQEQFPTATLAPTIWEVDIDYLDKPTPEWAAGFYTATWVLAGVGVLCGFAWVASLVMRAG